MISISKKHWCSIKGEQFDLNVNLIEHYNALNLKCPNCVDANCDWGPVVEADEKQELNVRKLLSGQNLIDYDLTKERKMQWQKMRDDVMSASSEREMKDYETPPSKYHIPVIGINTATGNAVRIMVDVYAIQVALNQTPQVAHSFKKLWAAGKRTGGKTYRQDIEEARTQLEMELNRLDLEEQFNAL